MNALLLHLRPARRSYLGRFSVPEPLAQLYVGPVLRPQHALRLVDLRITPDLERELEGFPVEAAVVGVNPLTQSALGPALERLRARHPRAKVLLIPDAEYGNSHVHERPLDFVHPLADALVPNYFLEVQRRTVPAALAAWEEGRMLEQVPGLWIRAGEGWRETSPLANEVGDIGVPDRALLGRARGRYRFAGIGRMAHLFYTYGCRFKCRFCPMSKHDGSISVRSLDDVMRELSEMSEPHVFLQDFEPFLAPEAMSELADAVEESGIRKRWYMLTRSDTALREEALIRRWQGLGLRWIYLGLDGSTPDQLKKIRKSNAIETNEEALRRMRELGLRVSVGFVVRPDFTREDFAALRGYVSRLRGALGGFTVETPFVGTKLFDESEDLLTTRDWSLYDLEHAVFPTALPLEDFYRELAGLQRASAMRSTSVAMRFFPFPDLIKNFPRLLGAMRTVQSSALDHVVPLDPGAQVDLKASLARQA